MKRLVHFEQYREAGRFKPVKPHYVKNTGVGPRPSVDSASVKLKEEDELNKKTPSVEELAKKHNRSVAEIEKIVEKGVKVEMEHTKDAKIANEIARDHISEKPDYYDKLKKYVESVNEDLRQWFDPKHPEGGWKRINSKGEAIGPCAREPGEPKPKCMSNEKRAKLSKSERASAVRAKRKHDPNAERSGKPINVSNFGKGKLSEDMEQLDEKNVPTSPEKWAQAKAQAKAKFDVYPSAYANGWAAKKYKEMGGGWKSVNEAIKAKDKLDVGEYDQEGDMAKSDLRSIMMNAKKVHDMLDDSTNLPEWVQAKITLAEDYISTVANYLSAELNEDKDMKSARIIKDIYKKKMAEEVEENIEEGSTGWHPSSTVKNPNFNDELSGRRVSPPGKRLKSGGLDYNERTSQERTKALMKYTQKKGGLTGPKGKLPEEVEQIDELKKSTLTRYMNTASSVVRHNMAKQPESPEDASKLGKSTVKRLSGYHKAAKRMQANEELEQVDEIFGFGKPAQKTPEQLSAEFKKRREAEKMKSAAAAAGETHAARKPDAGNPWRGSERTLRKENVEQIDEMGRPSQRHPLEGHAYHKKSDAELRYIAKDAGEAAEAMKGHNTQAENKYRDQVNDSATVRHWRKTNGMPDWYKKKYGHMKESNETAKTLAKMALDKKMGKATTKLGESRKARIVKDIVKNKKESVSDDKYQSEPILSSEIMKENK